MNDVAEGAFRLRVREWLEETLPQRAPSDEAEPEESVDDPKHVQKVREFRAALHDAGLAGLTWPVEYGGQGLLLRHQQIYNEEAAAFDVPAGVIIIGLGMCGPTILAVGTEEQKRRYIRPLLRADEIWCQLFSEPGAGSDLASLQTRAERDGDRWVVNGQKVWSSGAHYAEFGLLLARTDPDVPKHRGLTMFALDMRSPGVTVRPLRQMNGSSHFNEVFFDDVELDADALLGAPNQGWSAATTTLMNERVALGTATQRPTGTGFDRFVRLAREKGVAHDPVMRQRLAGLYIHQSVASYLGLRVRATTLAGRVPGPEGSVAKLASARLGRQTAGLGADLAGMDLTGWEADDHQAERWVRTILSSPAGAIAGGTDEIQHNIVAERVLGLPREPQVDRDVPFRELKVGTQAPERQGTSA